MSNSDGDGGEVSGRPVGATGHADGVVSRNAKGEMAVAPPSDLPKSPNAPKHQGQSKCCGQTGRGPTKFVEIASLIGSVIAAIAAAAGVWVTHGQLDVMRADRAADDLKEAKAQASQKAADARQDRMIAANEGATLAAERAASAALDNARIQSATFRTEERPRVEIDDHPTAGAVIYGTPLLDKPPSAPATLIWNVAMKNYGRSDALNVRIDKFVRVGDGGYRAVGTTGSPRLSPGGGFWFTVFFGDAIDPEQAISVSNTHNPSVEILLNISYSGPHGDNYSNRVCNFIFDTGTVGNCEGSLKGSRR